MSTDNFISRKELGGQEHQSSVFDLLARLNKLLAVMMSLMYIRNGIHESDKERIATDEESGQPLDVA